MSSILPTELKALLDRDPAPPVIDVRRPDEFREVHATAAVNLPLDGLSAASVRQATGLAEGEAFYVLCRSGARADIAVAKLNAEGLRGGVVVKGGTLAWRDAGLPVVTGPRQPMSLERQVRMAAGALVLTGLVLGWLVSPWFLFLSAFVGTGLFVSGLTDWCGMALLLARAPWNRVRS